MLLSADRFLILYGQGWLSIEFSWEPDDCFDVKSIEQVTEREREREWAIRETMSANSDRSSYRTYDKVFVLLRNEMKWNGKKGKCAGKMLPIRI